MVHERKDGNVVDRSKLRTPPSLFKRLDERFHFGVDIACTTNNRLCKAGFCHDLAIGNLLPIELFDALKASSWRTDTTNYCNPPYSPGNIKPFCKKAYEESLKGAVVVMLLPADLSTAYWRNYCMKAAEWIIIEGRVKFNNPDGTPMAGSPKFGSVAVVFDRASREATGHVVVSTMGWK